MRRWFRQRPQQQQRGILRQQRSSSRRGSTQAGRQRQRCRCSVRRTCVRACLLLLAYACVSMCACVRYIQRGDGVYVFRWRRRSCRCGCCCCCSCCCLFCLYLCCCCLFLWLHLFLLCQSRRCFCIWYCFCPLLLPLLCCYCWTFAHIVAVVALQSCSAAAAALWHQALRCFECVSAHSDSLHVQNAKNCTKICYVFKLFKFGYLTSTKYSRFRKKMFC